MAERVCPWWVGDPPVSPTRRWTERPEDMLSFADGPAIKRSRAVLLERSRA